jgi:hypothetical protein
MDLYSSIKWRDNFDPVYNATLINICADRSLFDYCDLSKYNQESVQPLLLRHGYNVSSNLKWIAVITAVEGSNLKGECGILPSWVDSFKLQWPRVALVPDIQGKLYRYNRPQ